MKTNVNTSAFILLNGFIMRLSIIHPVIAATVVVYTTHPPTPVPLSDEVKYLGIYLDPANSNRKKYFLSGVTGSYCL